MIVCALFYPLYFETLIVHHDPAESVLNIKWDNTEIHFKEKVIAAFRKMKLFSDKHNLLQVEETYRVDLQKCHEIGQK